MMDRCAGCRVIRDHEVESRENEDPHQVHKVPIQSQRFHFHRIVVSAFRERLEPHVDHRNHSADNVQRVEARHKEVERKEQRVMLLSGEQTVMPFATVFEELHDQEAEATENRQTQEETEVLDVALLKIQDRERHRKRAANQNEGVRERHRHVQVMTALSEDRVVAIAQHNEGTKEAREEHELRGKEGPHGQLAHGDLRHRLMSQIQC